MTTSEPQELVPESHNKGEQILTKTTDIFTEEQKAEYEVFSLVENTRKLITEEIVNHIYTPEVLSGLNEDVEARETPNAFISYNLQKAFLPWPISLIHFVPDWLILSVIGVIGLLLFRVLFDLGIDRFTLNRFLPIPILTDFENFNLTDTDTDTEN